MGGLSGTLQRNQGVFGETAVQALADVGKS